jgi:carbonic anhydrase
MKKLYKGLHNFKKNYFMKEEELFRRLSHKQEPEILFITCSDSRIDPNLVTQSSPGELFIVRNIGNMVPPASAAPVNKGAAAALEYAVKVLKVPDIIVCGHSNCGAMNALLEPELLDNLPHMKSWLKLAVPLRKMVDHVFPNIPDSERHLVAAQENVLLQLKNLESYQFISEALAEERLHIHGWYYDIGAGTISSYNPDTDRFEQIA